MTFKILAVNALFMLYVSCSRDAVKVVASSHHKADGNSAAVTAPTAIADPVVTPTAIATATESNPTVVPSVEPTSTPIPTIVPTPLPFVCSLTGVGHSFYTTSPTAEEIKFPWRMGFKSLNRVVLPVSISGDAPSGKQMTDDNYCKLLAYLEGYGWLHSLGTAPTAEDMVKRIIPQPGTLDFWGNAQKTKTMTRQIGYGGVSIHDIGNLYPGHVLFKPGGKLTKLEKSNDADYLWSNTGDYYKIAVNTMTVQNPAIYNDPIHPRDNANIGYIYPLDSKGIPDWDKGEWVNIVKKTAIGTGQNKTLELIVERSTFRKNFFPTTTKDQCEYPLPKELISESSTQGYMPSACYYVRSNAITIDTNNIQKYVVAVPMRFWSHQLQVNMSLFSAINPYTKETAPEWFARVAKAYVENEGLDGIEFDVGRWTWGSQDTTPMDVDNDLIVDHGYKNGVNAFGLGGSFFFKKLRTLLGEDKIIQSDSCHTFIGVRDWHDINGVQQESFPYANDIDRFSEAFLHMRMWVEGVKAAGRKPLTYGVIKTVTEAANGCTKKIDPSTNWLVDLPQTEAQPGCFVDGKFQNPYVGYNNRFRLSLAANTLALLPAGTDLLAISSFDPYGDNEDNSGELGGFFDWDEYTGRDNKYDKLHKDNSDFPVQPPTQEWLGSPIGELQRVSIDTLSPVASVSAGVSPLVFKWVVGSGFLPAYNTNDYTLGTSANAWSYTGTVNGVPSPVDVLPNQFHMGTRLEATSSLSFVPGEDYTITFSASGIAIDDLDDRAMAPAIKAGHTGVFSQVPLLLSVFVPMRVNNTKNPMSMWITSDTRQYSISFRAADCGNGTEFHFGCLPSDYQINGMAIPIAPIPLSFGISEQVAKKITISNIRVYKGSVEKWWREYENGAVLLNMSTKESLFSLPVSTLQVDGKQCHFEKLKGTVDTIVNNGESLEGATRVAIPPQDALFIKKACL